MIACTRSALSGNDGQLVSRLSCMDPCIPAAYTHHYACTHPGTHTHTWMQKRTQQQMLIHASVGELKRQQAGSRKKMHERR